MATEPETPTPASDAAGVAEAAAASADPAGQPTRAAGSAAAQDDRAAGRATGSGSPPVPGGRKVSTLLVGVLAGVLIGATAITSRGADLRPEQTGDLAQLAAGQEKRNSALAATASALAEQNDKLAAAQGVTPPPPDESQQELGQLAGLAGVHGPAVQVRLTDAPTDFAPPGVDGDLLVVHEQDIQQVVNALWTGGAEAMTIQGQRVIATTAVKCVGNTVVLQGVPYAPPYVITAIGDQGRLEAALAADPKVQIYRQYAQVYHLGYAEQRLDDVEMPAYTGPLPQQASAGGG